jgi:hypothetical protein
MSTLMHLPGNDINLALTELGRVIRLGGLLEFGVWGADKLHTRIDDHGRYFRLRTDDHTVMSRSSAATGRGSGG